MKRACHLTPRRVMLYRLVAREVPFARIHGLSEMGAEAGFVDHLCAFYKPSRYERDEIGQASLLCNWLPTTAIFNRRRQPSRGERFCHRRDYNTRDSCIPFIMVSAGRWWYIHYPAT
jgi:hypothetical protein